MERVRKNKTSNLTCATNIPTSRYKTFLLYLVFCGTLISLCSGCKHVQFFHKWDTKDTAMMVTSLGLTFMDYRMTSDISKRKKEGYYEKYNFLLGESPTQGQVNSWFISSALTKTLIASILPKNKQAWLGLGREFWLTWNVGISSDLIQNNFKIGLELNF